MLDDKMFVFTTFQSRPKNPINRFLILSLTNNRTHGTTIKSSESSTQPTTHHKTNGRKYGSIWSTNTRTFHTTDNSTYKIAFHATIETTHQQTDQMAGSHRFVVSFVDISTFFFLILTTTYLESTFPLHLPEFPSQLSQPLLDYNLSLTLSLPPIQPK